MQPVVLFWFRRDLRLHDNAGLFAALSSGLPVVPVFLFDTCILSHLEDRDDKRVSFIYAALQQLQQQLVAVGSTLDVRYGKPEVLFQQLLQTYAVTAVFTNHDDEPYATKRDAAVGQLLQANGVSFHTCKDQVIFEKNEVSKPDGSGYSMYSPYAKKWKTRLQAGDYKAYPSHKMLSCFFQQATLPLPSLQQMKFVFNKAIPAVNKVDEVILQHYHQTRNTPAVQGTTRMGVHLRFGTVSVRYLVAKALQLNEVYLNELIWREFFMQLLWHQPRLATQACKPAYDNLHWRNNEDEFEHWCNGKTGYPLVDAGMRELNETGFMHNRVRMVVASFLIKDLLVDWRWGEAYFARKLLDFELASNNGNWQWAAGCGCDAAPYFRVFNPQAQAKKFDAKSEYIQKWVPEFGTSNYPKPMVDHAFATKRCINAYKAALGLKGGVV